MSHRRNFENNSLLRQKILKSRTRAIFTVVFNLHLCTHPFFEHLWPFRWKHALAAFHFPTEFRLEAVWKPFERNFHLFKRPGTSIQKKTCRHPFEGLDHPFGRNIKPFKQLAHLFVKNIQLFERLAHPFGKNIHPFEWLPHPFDENVQPLKRLAHLFVKNTQPFEQVAHPFAGTSIRTASIIHSGKKSIKAYSQSSLHVPVRILAYSCHLCVKSPSIT